MKPVLSIILFGLLSSLTGKGVKSLTAVESPYVYMEPNWGVFLGGTVKISCCSFYFEKDVNVYLEKDGQIVDSTPNRPSSAPNCMRHDFEITNISLENGGIYSCYYYNPKTTSWSEHTESMELLIIDPRLPRPHISLSPGSTYVHSGSNITIHCWAKGPRKRFYFHFEYERKAPRWEEPDGDMANFTISNVSNAMYRFNEAIYRCSYRPLSGFPNSSELSDPVHLTLFDPAFYRKKPTIDLNPRKGVTLGGKITIYCERLYEQRDPNMSFYLQRPGNQRPDVLMQPEGDKSKFFISNASWEHRGRYSCTSRYLSSISGNPVISEPSDPVDLMIIDAALPRPNIAVSPSRMALEGSKIIILCWTNILSKVFYLHQRSFGRNLRTVKPEGNMAKFPITMNWGESGRYHCSYSAQSGNFTVSEISEDVQLFLIDFANRPTISLSPNKRITIGENVTILCQYDDQDHQFCLQKPGDQLVDECMETEAIWGKFLISNVNKEHAGRYRCRYNYMYRISEPSEPLELLIIDLDLPRPNISVIPNRMPFVGSNITIQCCTKGSSKRFYLHKEGGQIEPQLMESDGETATFSIVNINQSHGGTYKCSYRRPSGSSISSETSEAMDLWVIDPDLPRPAISINPNGPVSLGGQVTILCVAQDGPAMFYLHEAGHESMYMRLDSMLNCSMESKWDKGEFSISNISWEYQGNYSCSYAFYERPFVVSEHSDPKSLLISDPLETMDYAQVNNIRFAIGVVILLLLTYIVTSDYLFWKEQGRKETPKPQ